MIKTLLTAWILISSVAIANEIDRETIASIEVTRYIDSWVSKYSPGYQNVLKRRALPHVPSVVKWSLYYDIDPLLTAVTISLESSWIKGATGAIGEVGLMQVHSPKAKKGFDLSTGDGQIQAGVHWLRVCIDECNGSLEQGVNNYGTGSCTKEWSMRDYRLRKYRKAVRLTRGKHGQEKEE